MLPRGPAAGDQQKGIVQMREQNHGQPGRSNGGPSRSWIAASFFAFGSATGPLAVNAISDTFVGVGPPALASMVVAVLASIGFRHRRAPLFRLIRWIAVALAASAFATAILLPAWTTWIIPAAACLAVIGCLDGASRRQITMRLAAASLMALGITAVGFGIEQVHDSVVTGTVAICIGIGMVGTAVIDLVADSDFLAGIANSVVSFAVVGYGVALTSSDLAVGTAVVAVGVTLFGLGFAPMVDASLGSAAALASGVALIGLGTAVALHQDGRTGLFLGMAGAAVVVVVVAVLSGSLLAAWIALVVGGGTLAIYGALQIAGAEVLTGSATLALGLAVAGYGMMMAETRHGILAKLRSLAKEPTDPAS